MSNSTKQTQRSNSVLRRTLFKDFSTAGLSVFATATTQDPDEQLELYNILPAKDGGFRRRWGIGSIGSINTFFAPVRTFAYNVLQDTSDTDNTVERNLLISTDNQDFQTVQVNATSTNSPLANTLSVIDYGGYKPNNFSQPGKIYGLVSRRWFYFANAVSGPQKVNPSYTTKDTNWNWGIQPPAAYVDSSGVTQNTISAIGATGQGYTAPSISFVGGGGSGAAATAVISDGKITSYLVTAGGSNYSSNPSVIITDSTGTDAQGIAVTNDNGIVIAVLTSGYINLASGRTYTYAYHNSITGHTTAPAQGVTAVGADLVYRGGATTVTSPARGILGNIPAGAGFSRIDVTITPVTPIDPQVDTLILLATSDGGSLERLYEVARITIDSASPGTITFEDTLPDTINDSILAQETIGGAVTLAPVQTFVYVHPFPDGIYNVPAGASYLFSNYYNSLMFNPYPTTPNDGYPAVIDGYPTPNANQERPVYNAILDQFGNYDNRQIVQGNGIQAGASGPNFNFAMAMVGTFYVTTPGTYTLNTYVDSSYVMAIPGVTLVSGPTLIGGTAGPNSPIKGYPWLFGDNTNRTDWHNTAAEPVTITFPAIGSYPFEIGWAVADHDERCFSLLLNNQRFIPAPNNPFKTGYQGLTLLDANLWADIDSYGNYLGITDNQVPPNNLKYFVLHQGRIFATDGHSLFYTKNIQEVTTTTSLITSKWEEAWPGDNQLPISVGNETITGLISDGSRLHLGTTQSVYTLEGDSPSNFAAPNMLFQQTGVLSHDLWTVVYSNGEPAGYMWVTPDLKLLYSDFNTYNDIGVPIYPVLSQWDNSYLENAAFSAFTYGPYNFAVLTFKQAGASTSEFLVFETGLRRWYHWAVDVSIANPLSTFAYQHPPTGYRGLFFIDNLGGVTNYKLFDPARTTDTGRAIPYAIQTSWMSLNETNVLKVLNQILSSTEDLAQIVSVYGATKRSDFDNLPLIKSGPLVLAPLGTYKLFCAGANSRADYYSFRFENTDNSAVGSSPLRVLDSFEVEYYPMSEV